MAERDSPHIQRGLDGLRLSGHRPGDPLWLAVEAMFAALEPMTPEERRDVANAISDAYCAHCGTTQPKSYSCRCWDDS